MLCEVPKENGVHPLKGPCNMLRQLKEERGLIGELVHKLRKLLTSGQNLTLQIRSSDAVTLQVSAKIACNVQLTLPGSWVSTCIRITLNGMLPTW